MSVVYVVFPPYLTISIAIENQGDLHLIAFGNFEEKVYGCRLAKAAFYLALFST